MFDVRKRHPTLMHDRHSFCAAFSAMDRCTYWTLRPELGEHAAARQRTVR